MAVESSKHSPSLRAFLEGPRHPITLWLLVVLFPLSRSLAIPLAYDTAQEWSLARACLDRGQCSEGLRSSLLDVQHGRLVVWLIQITLRFHIPSWVLVATVTALVGVAAVVWLRATQSILGTALTWPFLLLAAAVVAKGDRLFWNLTPHPIATALFAAAILRVVATGRGAGWAALALGFAADLHVASPVLVPVLAFVVAWCSNRPIASAALSVVAMLVGPLLFSSACGFGTCRSSCGCTPAPRLLWLASLSWCSRLVWHCGRCVAAGPT